MRAGKPPGRTGAITLMQYPEVQGFAELYTLQSLFTDTLQPAFMAANHAGAILNAAADPYALPPSTARRRCARACSSSRRIWRWVSSEVGQQLSAGYSKVEP